MSVFESLRNVAIYLRKSRSDPEDESIHETLARHKKTLLEFAKKTNLTIVEIYEEVVSGDGLFVRPEMMRLMADVESDKYDGVLCVDLDRLGRVDTKDRGIILDAFKTHNTLIILPDKTYDLNNDLDEFSTEIQMLFARQELKKITARLQAGMRRTVRDGYHICEPPYGYRRAYIEKRPTLEICEEEAKIIRMVFDMYVNQGIGSSAIANTLNSMGLKPRKNDVFSRTTIQFYLQNETYIGKIVWNKKHKIKKKMPADKHRQVLNPREEWIVSEGVHPAIIDEDLFYRAQEIRKSHSNPPSDKGILKNPFAGLIKCKTCGLSMSRQLSKKCGPRLLCVTKNCNKSINIDKIENFMYGYFKDLLLDYDANVSLDTNKKILARSDTVTSQILELKKKISVLKNQKNNLHNLLEQGVYDIATFTDRGQVISAQITSLEQMLIEHQNILVNISAPSPSKETIPTLRHLVDNYYIMSPKEKNIAMKKLIEVIYYKRDKSAPKDAFEIEIVAKPWL